MKLNPNESAVLTALRVRFHSDWNCLNFEYLAFLTELDRKTVRRAVRSLARKGLACHRRGLFTEDGEVAGSGYACTELGYAFDSKEPVA